MCPAQNPPTDMTVRFGLTAAVVESEVNPSDALAATKVWAVTMGKGLGLWKESDARIYPDAATIVAALNKGDVDIVAMGTQEYLEVENAFRATPTLTYVQSGQIETQYLILVHQTSSIQTVEDLRGTRIALPKGGRYSIASPWLEVLVHEFSGEEKKGFFREIKEVQKPSQVILPIFFKQLESGIVIKSAFETAVQLNPQIGRELRILSTSPKIVPLVICLRNSLPSEQKELYRKQAMKLHENPSGLQAFNIFKLDRLVSWDPAYLKNIRDLMGKYKSLRSSPSRPANSDALSLAGK
jgi:ABC-type phosphate/phosphonate transport system substrate-binding protein